MASDILMVKVATIGLLGVGAQWVAWRTGKPAIIFLLVAGILAGPIFGWIDPKVDFDEWRQPIIKLAVAVILFEGGLTLRFADLKDAGMAVRRLVFLGVPIGWLLCSLAVKYGAGIDWNLSFLFGGILVVTGPTVIGPMLRAINVPRRVGDTLKWEAIVNDPIGALLAITVYALMTFDGGGIGSVGVVFNVLLASLLAGLLGLALGFAITWAFPRNYVPEYLKAPLLLVIVIASFVFADKIQHESGLITVTVMGVVMANRPTFSSAALRRFKEDLTVLLVSGVFIIMSASLDWAVISKLQARFIIYLVLLMFVARPLTVMLSLIGSDMPMRERLFIAWIAPRGIVAVAITGVFALRLTDGNVIGAELLVPLAFATAITTIVVHGFTAQPWARYLGIDKGPGRALLIMGVNRWSVGFAEAMEDAGVPVAMVDSSKFALREARRADLEIHHGDMLDDDFRHHFNWPTYHKVVATSDSDAYNALVCAELGPELGFARVLQVAPDQRNGMTVPRGGMIFTDPPSIYELQTRRSDGWVFSRTRITEQFPYREFLAQLKAGGAPIAVVRSDGRFELFSTVSKPTVNEGDAVIAFAPPPTADDHKARRAADKNSDKAAAKREEATKAAKAEKVTKAS